jgi:heptosyltransferase II
VDAIIPLPNDSFLRVVRPLRQEMRFDVAILFPNSLRVALESWVSGIQRRVGYRGHWRSLLVNQIVREPRKPGPPEHHSLHFLRIARECGAETSNTELPNLNQTSNLQPSHGYGLAGKPQTLIGLCPGAEYGPAKRWLPERFAEAAAKITAQSSAQWILLGTKNDAAIGEQIAAAIGDRCVNRIGQTTLDQLIAELRQCHLLLTNDTGTMHVAALLGVPVVAVFGSTEPRLTAPLGNGHLVLRHHVECSPCFLRECPIDFRCMKAVSADEVAGAVLSLLAK